VVTYRVKTTIPAITSKESEVIAFHSIFFCQGVGYKIRRNMITTLEGCNEKELWRGAAGNSRAEQTTPLQRKIGFE
jgi:hypothetical protein